MIIAFIVFLNSDNQLLKGKGPIKIRLFKGCFIKGGHVVILCNKL